MSPKIPHPFAYPTHILGSYLLRISALPVLIILVFLASGVRSLVTRVEWVAATGMLKVSLLERTVSDFGDELRLTVIVEHVYSLPVKSSSRCKLC